MTMAWFSSATLTADVLDEAATAKRREAAARRSAPAPLPMIDRGEGFEKMLRGECKPRMK